jgi:hypothetical protein
MPSQANDVDAADHPSFQPAIRRVLVFDGVELVDAP